ncbi:hypothetical protein PMY38_09635 [Clostridium tertium]|jgi:hypothetical protein|uniref:Uncharacterized protein n=1 Tax=Clostridium tertium TaxID=1559 RepID=A0A9X3XKR3_9CLOT|nr:MULTISPECIES: hypothetical protein [Clostridium]EEH97261.1 hypothetical protein CSBG_00887 [Clostridium sp. 7_2_43FAA]MBP1867302.1 hypothetical protein [Clostridium tertium]MBS5883911.1 hypothetical protein [Clostridium sp.]MBS6502569.1 hypothetical protein [Clostridium sp.]MBU6134792.1 hypothetical protein [Clostridium tertium]
MKDNRISLVIKSFLWGIAWFGVAVLIGFIITKVTAYKNFENILFIEGIILVFVGIFASISGDPMGLSMQGLGQNSAQYSASANLEVTKMEREKSNRKLDVALAVSTFSLILGGVFSAGLTFII